MNLSEASNASSEKHIEGALKELLEKILLYMEKFIETKDDLQQVEEELKDYENLTCLINIIKTIFQTLSNKIDLKMIKLEKQLQPQSQRSIRTEEEYEKLEQIIQKHEAEIRNHIRVEQQLKLYAESIQAKLDDSEQTRNDLLEQTKQMVVNIKRDNQRLSDLAKASQEENEELKKQLRSLESEQKEEIKNLQLMIKNSESKKHSLADPRIGNSVSEHKHSQNQIDSQQETDFPQQSQKNYMVGITPQKKYSQHETANTDKRIETLKSQVRNHTNGHETDIQRIYGHILKSKNNSIASIKQMSIKKLNGTSQNVSKQSSQNTSFLHKQHVDTFIGQQKSVSQTRASSALKRNQVVKQKPKAK